MPQTVPDMGDMIEIGVVGAGFMGSGIAESAARAGIAVRLFEPDPVPLRASRERIEASVQRGVRGGKLEATEAAELVDRITWTSDLGALEGAQLVVEAIVEDEMEKVG